MNGFYRRLCIIPFERKFSDEEADNFDINRILNQQAIDYLANIALREYLNMKNKKFANEEENQEILNFYHKSNDSVTAFLEDNLEIADIFKSDNKILNTGMYARYVSWCKNYNYFIKKKSDFYEMVLSDNRFVLSKYDGRDYIKNITIEKVTKKPNKPITF